jgi:membrane associated rhomboid family serine protease
MTIIILIVTAGISILAFNRPEIMSRLQFNPYQTYHQKHWYRLISHGFVHAGWLHLIINMLVFWSFGAAIEQTFDALQINGWMNNPQLNYFLLYFGGIVFSSLLTLKKHKDNPYYNSVGASGAVSAVVFTSIFFDPWRKIYFYGIIGIPGILLGLLYLGYSYYMGKKGEGMINHDAHFVGAVYGLLFPIIVDVDLAQIFIHQLLN